MAHRSLAKQFFHPALRRPVARHSDFRPLFFYSQVAWDTVWQRPQEEALGLSRHRDVIFFSPVQIHELAARLTGRWKFCRRLRGGRLTVLSPVIFSGEYRSPAIRRVNRRILRIIASRAVGASQPIFMTNSPFSSFLLPTLRPRRVVFDIIDDFSAFSWAPREARSSERYLISQTDLAFAGTGYLKRLFAGQFPDLEFLPSGVKLNTLTKPAAEPDDLTALPHPRILYVGTINDRLNPELFRALAREFPQGSIVAVGPCHGTFSTSGLPKNTHFLGLKPHGALAGYYQHCDLGIMPFANIPAAHAINPIKTLEYLAVGLPVLSTPIPDVVEYYADVVRAEEPGAWRRAARELIDQDTDEAAEVRRRFARNRGWRRLTDRIEQELRRLEGSE